jgi:DNA-binding NarL/FixJ family response regulator
VLLIDEATLLEFEPAELAGVADYGRAIRILVIGPARDEQGVLKVIRAGCMGFEDEEASPATLKKAVRALARGELWVSRQVTAQLVHQLLCLLSSRKLTSREREILRLIARGLKNRAIAERLSISHETVRWHIRSLHSKLGLQDRLGTALYAEKYLGEEAVASPRPVRPIAAGMPES